MVGLGSGEFSLVLIGSYWRIGQYTMAYLCISYVYSIYIYIYMQCMFFFFVWRQSHIQHHRARSFSQTEIHSNSFWETGFLNQFLKIFDHTSEILPWKLFQFLSPGSCRCFLHWRLGIRCDFPAHSPSCLVEQEPGGWPRACSWNDGTNKLGLLPRICKGFTHLVRSRRSGLAFVC